MKISKMVWCMYPKRSSRSSHPEGFLGKGVPKICNKFTGEHPCWSVISIKLQSNFSEHLFLRTSLEGCFCQYTFGKGSLLTTASKLRWRRCNGYQIYCIFEIFLCYVWPITRFFYKQLFYKQRQAKISKKRSTS